MSNRAYADAGVDIALATRLLREAKGELKLATRPEVLGGIGGFGGLFDISRLPFKHPVLVSSTDSVGTKVKAATMAGMHDAIGHDIVHHCCNDIAVTGAQPLFFLDYFASTRLREDVYPVVLKSVARACRGAKVALIGGETAEMPGVYKEGEYDLVGTIVGAVDKPKILTGAGARPGDVLLGLPSSGLHTNGFSLARKVLFEELGLSTSDPLPGSRTTVGKALLKPHLNYANLLLDLYARYISAPRAAQRKGNQLYAAAHITGGGLVDNLPRVLPEGTRAVIETASWKPLPIFSFLAEKTQADREELYQVFNMGIGLVLVVHPDAASAIISDCQKAGHKAVKIGQLEKSPEQPTVELRF